RIARLDLGEMAPPRTAATRDAETFMRDVCSPQVVNHSLRTYYFSAIVAALSPAKPRPDLEVLFVGCVMHDVGLFDASPPPEEHCFTVGCAREARRIAARAGWDATRVDRMAAAITSNLNMRVGIRPFGAEAHFLTLGGRVEVLAEEWKVHPDNVAEVLARFPR